MRQLRPERASQLKAWVTRAATAEKTSDLFD